MAADRIVRSSLSTDPALADVVREYVASLPTEDQIDLSVALARQGRTDELRALGYQLRCSGGSHGFAQLSALGSALERAILSGSAFPVIAQQAAGLRELLGHIEGYVPTLAARAAACAGANQHA